MLDLETAFARMGGFGRLQWLSLLCICFMRNSGHYLYYCFAYLTLDQVYQCATADGGFELCSLDETICPARTSGAPLEYQVDTSYEYYLNNWFTEMDLLVLTLLSHSRSISMNQLFR